jgi:TorA maturation chaperone TorD
MMATASAIAPEREREGWSVFGEDLALLARLHDREVDASLIESLRTAPVADWFALKISGETFERGADLLSQALLLAPLPMTGAALDEMAAEYAAIYLNHTYRISPCESFWTGDDGLERQDAMFSVRSCYARLGFRAPNWRMRPDDHIALELSFLAQAAPRLGEEEVLRIVAEFMRAHMLVWIPDFAGRVARRCLSPFYAGAALLTVAYLENLASALQGCFGFDMTPIQPEKTPLTMPQGQTSTCADPPPRYAPGSGPGW